MLDLINWMEGRPVLSTLTLLERASKSDEVIFQAYFQGTNTADPAATPFEIFKYSRNHVDAASSILSFAGHSTIFHPNTQNPVELARWIDAYIAKIDAFPGFLLTFNEQSQTIPTSTNIDTMVSGIKSTFDGVLAIETKTLVDTINRMANTVVSQSTSNESRVMFVVLGVTAADDSDLVEISIFYAVQNMKKDETTGKKTYAEQSFAINRTVLKILTSTNVANAAVLAARIPKVSMEDWLRSVNCPTDPKVQSCFERHLQTKEN
ncbi:hypothetical protein BGX33_007334 [Mortierella sp. NVP41]|nr:hypothetical protein BGX33_007334 [Mortierella sp. NVP41]